MPRTSLVNLGILGVPADWDERYAEALAALASRVRLLAVYDSQPCRARLAARNLGGSVTFGVRALLEPRQLDAILYLNRNWQREWAADACFARGLPVFIGQQLLRDSADWEESFDSVRTGILAVPETLLRYNPVMLRLRELMATSLGPLRDVWFSLPRAQQVIDAGLSLREVLNWFWSACGASAVRSTVDPEKLSLTSELRFLASLRSGADVVLVVQTVDLQVVREAGAPFGVIQCERGSVELMGPRELRWICDNGEATSERLHADRSATRVALDLFTRRVAGGLIPVPALPDLVKAQQLAKPAAVTIPTPGQ
jgi:predicted dehydrogenase